jgi:PleD family two-component response regulator
MPNGPLSANSANQASTPKSPGSARVLIAGDEAKEARQLVELLNNHFDYVWSSTNADTAVAEFEEFAPDIILMAFKALEQAERYYLALHRFGQSIYRRRHRTILLCGKEDTVAAFELCKKRFFDDYVLYWPNPQDGLRIPMSVWLAARELQAEHRDGPSGPELRTHANHLEALDRNLTHDLDEGVRQAAVADESLVALERALSGANDEFLRHLAAGGAKGAIEVKDPDALARELAAFKKRQIDCARTARDRGVRPMNSWAKEFKEKVAPALARTRTLATQVRESQPLLLVIDDDAAMRSALEPVLTSLGYDLVLAASGREGLRELAHIQPDVVLMDVKLTDIDGINLTRQLRSIPQLAHTPVVLMSGDSRRDTLINGIEAGATDFLAKPFTREVLRTKLDKVLHRAEPAES